MSEGGAPQRAGRPRIVIRFGKSEAERRLTRVTMGLLVVWMGVMIAIRNAKGVGPLGAGGILLASAVYARMRHWYVGRLQWVFGAVLVLVGLGDIADTWDVPWFGIGIIVAGCFILYRAFTGPRVS